MNLKSKTNIEIPYQRKNFYRAINHSLMKTAAVLAVTTGLVATASGAHALSCSASPTSTWATGYVLSVDVTNDGTSPVNSWVVELNHDQAPAVSGAWNASTTVSGNTVTASNVGWNGSIAPGQSVSFGYQGLYNGSFVAPDCAEKTATGPVPTPTLVPSIQPTLAPTLVPTATPTALPTLMPTATPTPVITPEVTPDPVAHLVIQEQENGFCKVDGSIDDNNQGFTGVGFANTDNASGKGITWSVNAPANGNYELAWRYANGSSSNRSGVILVNDAVQANIDFNGTSAWTNWAESDKVTVYLNAGKNIIQVNADTSGGLPNVDSFSVYGENVLPADCGTSPTPAPTSTPTPVPTSNVTPTPTSTPTPVPTPGVTPTPTSTPTPTPTPKPTSEPSGPVSYDTNVPMGWAVVSGYGLETTTGGAGGEVVTATTHSQLKSYVADDTPRIVRVKGSFSGGDIDVGSNKTIIGVGADTKLSGFYLNMNGDKNIIIRNLEITGGTDAIAARYTNHLWIDHVFVHACSDGLIDLTRETDMYTVTWSEFQNHHKTMLLNGGSRHYDDRGKLNGTLHHNFFNGTDTRNPRAGFGKIHIFNDYNYKNSYGIGFHTESKVLAEQNYFEDTSSAIKQMYTNADELGDALSIGNILDNSSRDDSTGIGFDPTQYYMYDFVLDAAADVPSIVRAGAGPAAEYGEIGLMPIPGQGAVNVSTTTLSWKTGTYNANSYVVYFGTNNNPPKVGTTTSTSYQPGSLSSGQVYYWRVDQVTSSGTIPGKLWKFKAK